MRVSPTLAVALAAGALTLAGCAVPQAESTEPPRRPALSFDYEAEGGSGYIDQTLTITNKGAAAAAPTLDVLALDASGAPLPGVDVVTAFGSDSGGQVVPAYTQVIDVLRFRGAAAADVADVRVTVTDPGALPDDVPPANDLRVKRFDVGGSPDNENTLGSVLLRNTYGAPVRVAIVGLEFEPARDGELQSFRRVTRLAGPLEIEPGEKVREQIARRDRTRFYGSVRAYLVP